MHTPVNVPYPAVVCKKVTTAFEFDGGRLSSDSGVVLLLQAERRRGIAKALASLIADPRDPAHVTSKIAASGPAAADVDKDITASHTRFESRGSLVTIPGDTVG